MKLFHLINLFVFFIKELILANLQVTWCLLVPNSRLKPAIVAVPLSLKTDFGIMVLANLITLTPGTLSLDVSADKKKLFVHVIHCPDPIALKKSITQGFEKRIKGVWG